ncbi:MAG: chemotaxis protein CheX [Chitinispirillia bacterium]|nr:chemotaxis protein CheX [Chitinispirillia bacterium]MCL2269587.1 chemotaxis protein CheX [Chitinispirillia bacterium]
MGGQNGLILDSVCKQKFEELAFFFCESQDAAAFDYNKVKDAHKASMLFTGPKNGKFEMAAGEKLCLLLASNMLGIEPDDGQASELADDALKESLNVICGNFLTEAYGEEAVFSLTAPVIGAINDLTLIDENAVSEDMLYFEIEEQHLVVKLTVYK